MNRIFHARIHALMYALVLILLFGAGTAFWYHMPICGGAFLLLLVLAIERIIHTTYTITADGLLCISYGRFARTRTIPLKDIVRVERIRRMRTGRHCLLSYLLIVYGQGKETAVMPMKEDEFMETLIAKRKKL